MKMNEYLLIIIHILNNKFQISQINKKFKLNNSYNFIYISSKIIKIFVNNLFNIKII
jgi:hypothetical protein